MIDEIKWWLYSKCLGWQMDSRYKFIRLSKYSELYISYSWDNDKLYLTLYDPENKNKNIIELNLNASGDITHLKNKEIPIPISGGTET